MKNKSVILLNGDLIVADVLFSTLYKLGDIRARRMLKFLCTKREQNACIKEMHKRFGNNK